MSALRERKKAALRATIVREAVELFVQRGYDSVGMEEIAYASMCSRSTLNRYFGTKEDVLFPAVSEVIEGLRSALNNMKRTDDRWTTAREAVTMQLGQFFENFEPDPRVGDTSRSLMSGKRFSRATSPAACPTTRLPI
jgi:AcrR family transcriptional regulator